MTCIAGIRTDEGTWLACDTEMAWGWTKERSVTKIHRTKNLLIAHCGSAADAFAIEQRFSEPKMLADRSDWLLGPVSDAMRSAVSSARLIESDNGRDSCHSRFLIGTSWGLWSMDSMFALYPAESGYMALGSGGQCALGSLYTSSHEGHEPKSRLDCAVNAAQLWSTGCGGKVIIESIGVEGGE